MRLSQGSIPSGPKMRSYSTAKLPNMGNNDKPASKYEPKHELKLRNRGYSLSKIKMA